MSITPSPFVPTRISGCSLWLDASDTSTMTLSGSSVTQLQDKISNQVFSPGVSPTYTANDRNGRGVISFNGTQYLNNTTFVFPNTSYTVYALFFYNTTSGFIRFINGNPSADTFLVIGGFDRNIAAFTGTGGAWNNASALSPTTDIFQKYVIVGLSVNVNAINAFVNGTTMTSNTGTTGAFTGLSLGGIVSGNNTSNLFNGKFCELLVFNSALSASDRRRIELYLALKWAVTENFTALAPASFPLTTTPYSASFSPTSIPNCVLWLDAADNSRISPASGTISTWTDKAQGIVMTAQGTTANLTRLTGSAGIGGLQALRFDNSSSDAVYMSGSLQSFTAGSAFIIFQSYAQRVMEYRAFFTWNNNANGTFAAFGNLGHGGSTNLTIGPYTTFVGNGTLSLATTAGTNYLAAYSWNGTVATLGFNGTPPTTGTLPNMTSSTTTFWICADGNGASGRANTEIGEIILFSRVISESERQQIESYLANKWSLEPQLPTNHTHFNNPAGRTREITKLVRGVVGFTIPLIMVNNATLGTDYTIENTATSATYFILATGKTINLVVSKTMIVTYIALGGGGGGGAVYAGGGGAGGLQQLIGYSLAAGSYDVVIGTGGAGGTDNGAANEIGKNGVNTTVSGIGITAFGGGGGGSRSNGNAGGCGGGAAYQYFTGGAGSQGFKGGDQIAGGGGVTSAGGPGNNLGVVLSGGAGIRFMGRELGGGGACGAMNGTSFPKGQFGGGDGGIFNVNQSVNSGTAGQPNTGGGGGGGTWGGSAYGPGSPGGSGIFIIHALFGTHLYFDYTGSNQSFVVPAGVSSVRVFIWGAGGGGGNGGAGAYIEGILTVTAGETLTIVVGQGGFNNSSAATYGGGGGNQYWHNPNQGSGGGRSAIIRSSVTIVVAGGGGGCGYTSTKGGAATFSGTALNGTGQNSGGANGGRGGSQTAGGVKGINAGQFGNATDGALNVGGDGAQYGGGGGGGFYGGGGGSTFSGDGGSGGGGSSLTTNLLNASGQNSSDGILAPALSSMYYSGTVGRGGLGSAGGNGRLVIQYT